MEHGDISNAVSPRLMINYDVVTKNVFTTTKVLGFRSGVATRRIFEPVSLNRIWRYTARSAITLELVNFGVDDAEAASRLEELDRKYVNPFNHSTAWVDIEELLEALPYRPDVVGVMDVPERQARYGLRGLGIDHLDRAL